MCYAIPGKVIEVDSEKNEAIVEYGKEKRTAQCFFEVKEGDYVIVSQKIIIKKVPEDEAKEAIKFFMKNLDEEVK